MKKTIFPFLSSIKLLLISSLIVNMVNYLFHLSSARLLSVTNYGVVQTIINILNLTTIGISVVNVQLTKKFGKLIKNNEYNTISYITKKIIRSISRAGLLITILVLLIPANYLSGFGNITKWQIIALLLMTMFSYLIATVRTLMKAGLNFGALALNTNAQSILRLIIVIPLLLLSYKTQGAVWGMVLSLTLIYFLSRFQVKKLLSIKNNPGRVPFHFKLVVKDSIRNSIGIFGLTSLVAMDLILVQKYLPGQAGLYAALMFFGKIIIFATSPISSVLFPSIIHAQNKKHENKLLYVSLGLVSFLAVTLLISYSIFPELIIRTLLSKSYLPISPLLVPYSLFILFYSISYLLVNGFIALNKYLPSYLALIAALSQIVGIIFFHSDLRSVVFVSLIISVFLLLSLTSYLIINRRLEKQTV